MRCFRFLIFFSLFGSLAYCPPPTYLLTISSGSDANVAGTLRHAITQFNVQSGNGTFTFLPGLTTIVGSSTGEPLPPINYGNSSHNITLNFAGSPFIINGSNTYRGLVIGTEQSNITVNFNNGLTFIDCVAAGGAGGAGNHPGGGGAGLGGGLLIVQSNSGSQSSITTAGGLTFQNCSAVGGAGQTGISSSFTGGGGGGGTGGAGGASTENNSGFAGGGGGGGFWGTGGASGGGTSIGGGSGGGTFINGNPGTSSGGGAGTSDGGGAGGTENTAGTAGGTGLFLGGGGGGSGINNPTDTAGGDGGVLGGGGGGNSQGGIGGFGGGGGGAPSIGGTGGYGGGGGAANYNGTQGVGGFGGGTSATTGGSLGTSGSGGGAGLGGALLIPQACSFVFSAPFSFSGNSCTGGASGGSGATAGQALGPDVLLQSGGTIAFQASQTFSGIAGDTASTSGSVTINTSGVVVEFNSSNVSTYNAPTTLTAGTLLAGANNAFSPNSLVTVSSGAVLNLNDFSNAILNLSGVAGSSVSLGTVGAGTLTLGDSTTQTFSGSISGTTGGLVMQGTGTFVLAGTATYSGATQVQAGTLLVGSSVGIPSTSLIDVFTGATFNLNSYAIPILNLSGSTGSFVTLGTATLTVGDGTTQTFSGTISGSSGAGILMQGTGTLVLAGTNTYPGNTAVTAGTLQAGSTTAFPSTSLVSVSSGATFSLNGFSNTILNLTGSGGSFVALGSGTLTLGDPTTQTFSGNISGSGGSILMEGTGTLVFAGTNTYSGTTEVSAGTLQAGSTAGFSPNSLVDIVAGATLNLNGYSNTIGNLSGSTGSFVTLGTAILTAGDSTTQTFSGVLSGSTGGLTKQGTGTLVLAGTTTYSGTTQVSAGTLQVGALSAFPSTSLVDVLTGATFNLNSYAIPILNLSGSTGSFVALGSSTLTVGDGTTQTFSGTISGSGSAGLLMQGTGTLVLAGANTYPGSTDVTAGTLQAGSTTAFPSTSLVIVSSGATFNLNGFSNTILNLSGPSGSFVALGSGTLTLGDGTTQTFSGNISGSGGAILMQGTGTLVLAGANTYSGTTEVSAGTLQAGSTTAFSSSSLVDLVAGATFNLNGFSNTISNLTGSTGSFVNLGSAVLSAGDSTIQTFSGNITGTSGGLTKLGSGTLVLAGTDAYSGTTQVSGGTLQAGSTTAFSSTSLVDVLAGATFSLNGFSNTVLNLTGSTGSFVSLGSAVLSAGDATIQTFSGNITGTSGGLTKLGSGTLVLAGIDAYSGTTQVSAGTLAAGSTTAFSSTSLVDVVAGATFSLNGFSNTVLNLTGSTGSFVSLGSQVLSAGDATIQTFSGNITGTSGGLTKLGSGTLVLAGANAYSGATQVSAGTLQAGSTTAFPSTSLVDVLAGATFSLNGFSNTISNLTGSTGSFVSLGSQVLSAGDATIQTFSGNITGTSGGLTKLGSGTLVLAGTDAYSGTTQVSAGTLQAGSTTAFSSTSLVDVLAGATFSLNGFSNTILNLKGSTGSFVALGSGILSAGDATIQTFSGNITGTTGGLTKLGSGTLVLAGTSSYSGATHVSAGTLQAGSTTAFSSTSLVDVLAGATFSLNGFSNTILNLTGSSGSFVSLGSAVLSAGDATIQTFSGNITGSGGGLTKLGSGTLVLAGANAYSGTTEVSAGTLQAGSTTAFSSTSLVDVLAGATFSLNGFSNTVLNLTGSSGSFVSLGSAILSAGDATIQTFSGNITGTSGGLTKLGSGTLVLSGTDAYSGTTQVSAGTLAAGSTTAFSSTSLIDVVAGATFSLNGFSNTILNLTGSGGSFVSLGSGILSAGDATIQTFSGNITGTSGGLTKLGSGTLVLAGVSSYSGTTQASVGTLQAGSTTAFSSTSLVDVLAGATFSLNGFSNTIGNLTGPSGSFVALGSAILSAGDATIQTFSGNITGTSGGLTKLGAGTLVLAGTDAYSGTTLVSAGTLQAGSTTAFSSTSLVDVMAGATFSLNGFSNTILNLTGSTGSFVSLGSGILSAGDATIQTFSGNITGTSGGLIKLGSGTLVLGGASSYSGTTEVSVGTLAAGSTTAFSSTSLVDVVAGATFSLNGFSNTVLNLTGSGGSFVALGSGILSAGDATIQTFSGNITGTSGGLTKLGSGTLVLAGTDAYSGTTQVSAGTLQAGSTTAFSSTSLVDVLAGATFSLNGFSNTILNLSGSTGSFVSLGSAILSAGDSTVQTFSGNLTGTSGGLTKLGSGILVLAGTSSYSGTTQVSAGTLQAGSTTAFSSTSLVDVLAGATFSLNGFSNTVLNLTGSTGSFVSLGAGTLTVGDATPTQTFSGNISGTSGGLIKQGSGTLILGGADAYSGTTEVSAGRLQAGSTTAFSSTSVVAIASGATFSLNGYSNRIGNLSGPAGSFVTLGSGILSAGDSSTQTFSGNITGTSGGLTKLGSGALILAGTNSYSGTTQVSVGTLQAGSTTAFSSTSLVDVLAGATFSLNGFSNTILNLTGSTGSFVALGSGTLTLGDATTQTFSGAITGGSGGGVLLQGTGTLVLAGANTYSGTTEVKSGTLQAGSTSGFSPNSLVDVVAGATFSLNGFSNTILNLSGSTGSFVTLGSATLTLGDSTTQTFSGDVSGSNGSLVVQGTGTLVLAGANTYSGTTRVSAGTLQAGSTTAFPSTSLVDVMAGATFSLNGFSNTVLNLTGSSGSFVSLGSGILSVGDATTQTFSGNITGTSGALTKLGSGILVLAGANAYSGTTQVSAGTLSAGSTTAFPSTSLVDVLAGATFNLNNFSNTVLNLSGSTGSFVSLGSGILSAGDSTIQTFSGNITGTSGGLTKLGSGTLVLAGTDAYSGTTQVSAGTLEAGSTGAFPSTSLVVVSPGATFSLNGYSNTVLNLSGSTGSFVSLGSAILSAGDSTTQTFSGNITGTSGGLTKLGSGTLVLAGTDAYSGTTEVSAGTLQAGSTTAFSSTSLVDVEAGATFDLNGYSNTILNLSGSTGSFVTLGSGILTLGDGTTETFSGNISGTGGGILLQGTGSLVLGGSNSYSGGTQITDGSLEAISTTAFSPASLVTLSLSATLNLNSNSNTILNLSGPAGSFVTLGDAALTLGDSTSQTFSGEISGTGGSLVKVGTGALTLAGTNTYTGGTQISAGTLLVGPLSFGSGGITFTGTSTLSFTGTSTVSNGITINSGVTGTIDTETYQVTLAEPIISSAALNKIGLGTLILEGANTNSGTVNVTSGTLQAGGMNTLSPNAPVVLSNVAGASLNLNNYSNTIASLSGGGTTGGNVFLGTMSVATLTLGGDNSSTTFSGAISGIGGITKTGTGIFTLASNSNSYTGPTQVSEGTLSITGAITSATTVDSGAALRGTGSITGAVDILSGGTLSPGNSPGQISIVGTLTFNPSSIFSVEVSPSAYSSTSVTGAVIIEAGSILDVTVDSGIYSSGTEFQILSATDGLSGEFNPPIFSQPGFQATPVYTSTSLSLLLTASFGQIATTGLIGNSLTVANYINALPMALFDQATNYLTDFSSTEMAVAMQTINPSRNSFSTFVVQQNAFTVTKAISMRIEQRRAIPALKSQELKDLTALNWFSRIPSSLKKEPEPQAPGKELKCNFWLTNLGNWSYQDAQEQNPAFRFFSGAELVGVDVDTQLDGVFVGGMAGYLFSSVHEHDGYGNQSIKSFPFGFYAFRKASDLFIESFLGGCYNRTRSYRHITFSGFDEVAKSKFITWQILPHAKVGYDWNFASMTLTPFASFDIPVAFQSTYVEHGADIFDMRTSKRTSAFFQFFTGLSAIETWEIPSCLFTFKQEAGYIYRAPFKTGRVTAAIIGAPSTFQVVSFTGAEQLGDLSLEFFVKSRRGLFGVLSFDGQLGNEYKSLEALAGLGFEF